MTDIEITPADRAAMIRYENRRPIRLAPHFVQEIRDGQHDSDDRVQAFARHRVAATSHMIIELDAALPDEIELFRILRAAGRKNADKARAVLAALPDPVKLRALEHTGQDGSRA